MSTRSNKHRLIKTGQTTSIRTGDDGYFEAGGGLSPRFVDNGDGTITDRLTNLMWVKSITKLIPGAPGVTSDNLVIEARGNWDNGTSYVKGDVTRDPESVTSYYICAADHTSVSGAPQGTWTQDAEYDVDDIVKDVDTSPDSYWKCLVEHTSFVSLGEFSEGTSYSVGDVVVGSDSKYYRCTSAHTSFTSTGYVGTWSGTAYVNDIVYDDMASQGYGVCTIEHSPFFVPNIYQTWAYYNTYDYCTPNYVDAYECNSGYSDSGEGFDYWANNWNSWGHVGFEFDETYQQSDCWDVYATNIAVDEVINGSCWSDGYTSIFALERAEEPTWWESADDEYSFLYDRTENPTYWRQTTWIGNVSPMTLTYPKYEYWPETIDKCLALEFAGYDDWRCPNVNEMQSILEYENLVSNNNNVPAPFEAPYWSASNWWTSTTARMYTYYALFIGCSPTYKIPYASLGQSQSGAGNWTAMVRPVRTIN